MNFKLWISKYRVIRNISLKFQYNTSCINKVISLGIGYLFKHAVASHKNAVMFQYRACTGPMLPASDQYRLGTGN